MKKTLFLNNEKNYVYDANKIQILGGKAALIATVIGAEAYAYWKMDDNDDEVFRDSTNNSRDLRFAFYTAVNKVPAKINNGLQGISTSSGFCRFGVETNDFSFERTDPFSFEFWIKYTGTATRAIISKQKETTNFSGYLVVTTTPGLIRFVIRDNSNNIISVETNSNYNDNIFHHVVVTYDGSSSHTGMKIYVDNVLDTIVNVSGALIDTIKNSNISFQVSGRNGPNDCIDSNTILDEVVVYARELTPAEVSFRWNNGDGTQDLPGSSTSFPTDNPTLKSFGVINANKINGVSALTNIIGLDEIRAVVEDNGVAKYWDGGAWVESSGYSQSNTIAEIDSNVATLLSNLAAFNIIFFFHSNDGSSSPELLEYDTDFDNERTDVVLSENIIFGNLLDIDSSIPEKYFLVQTFDYTYGTNIITTSDRKEVVINPDGSFLYRFYFEDKFPDGLIWTVIDKNNALHTKIIKTNFLPGINSFGQLTIL